MVFVKKNAAPLVFHLAFGIFGTKAAPRPAFFFTVLKFIRSEERPRSRHEDYNGTPSPPPPSSYTPTPYAFVRLLVQRLAIAPSLSPFLLGLFTFVLRTAGGFQTSRLSGAGEQRRPITGSKPMVSPFQRCCASLHAFAQQKTKTH